MKITKTRQVTQSYTEEVCDICENEPWGAKIKALGFGNMGGQYAVCSICWDLLKELVRGEISFGIDK